MKIILNVQGVVKGIILWEILPADCTVTADLYFQQLALVAEKLHRKQNRIYFLHGKTSPHIAKSADEKLLKLGGIKFSCTSYSPDLAPIDYHLFRSLSNYLGEKRFHDENDLKKDLTDFFAQKSQEFYEHEILSLPGCWQQVTEN